MIRRCSFSSSVGLVASADFFYLCIPGVTRHRAQFDMISALLFSAGKAWPLYLQSRNLECGVGNPKRRHCTAQVNISV